MQWKIVFGKTNLTGLKTGFMREHTIEEQPDGWLTRERSSSMGHRKMRRADSRIRASNDNDPFARPTSIALKSTGVENAPDDHRAKDKKMSPKEIQDYLYRSGTGLMQRDVAAKKSHDFLDGYDVLGPVTKEQKQRRRHKKSV